MSITADLKFKLVPIPAVAKFHGFPTPSPLGRLADLPGVWMGNGFNQIFRPFSGGGSDNFLELNLTNEKLEFTEIPGEIANRGLVFGTNNQHDISLFGLTYLQQISDINVKGTDGLPAGIHIEPGIWVNIPLTQDPSEPDTVARMASIPHGTTLLAQGTAQSLNGPPQFDPVDITPFAIGADPRSPGSRIPFPSQDLSQPSTLRSPPNDIVGITQAMVDNPNSVLQTALAGKAITSHVKIQISTTVQQAKQFPPVAVQNGPDVGGGTSNIAFLAGTQHGPNANTVQVDAIFWISHFTDHNGSGVLLQYSQVVLLNFAPLSWPHVSVANLFKQVDKNTKDFKDAKEHKLELKEHKPEIKEHKPEIKEHKPEIKEHKPEIKEHKPEIKEVEIKAFEIPGPGPVIAGAAKPAPAGPQPDPIGRPFIQPDERPAVGDAALKKGAIEKKDS